MDTFLVYTAFVFIYQWLSHIYKERLSFNSDIPSLTK
jgi:hypothetical protein